MSKKDIASEFRRNTKHVIPTLCFVALLGFLGLSIQRLGQKDTKQLVTVKKHEIKNSYSKHVWSECDKGGRGLETSWDGPDLFIAVLSSGPDFSFIHSSESNQSFFFLHLHSNECKISIVFDES